MANIFESNRVLNTISIRKQNIFCEWKRSLLKMHINYVSRVLVMGILFEVIIMNNLKPGCLLYLSPGLTSTFCPQIWFVCFAWISDKEVIIFLCSFSWFIQLCRETECVYCAVRTEYLNNNSVHCQGLKV